MMMMVPIWIGCAVLVGILGRKMFLGFLGNFVLSLIFSPLVPLIFILVANLEKKFQKNTKTT